jgi:3D (Asp-Asp-Asp) domain-containing protein
MKRIIILSFIFLFSVYFLIESKTSASSDGAKIENLTIFSKESKLLLAQPICRFSLGKIKKRVIVRRTITAYSIHKHLTASGRRCKRGIVAANWLPLGTKIMIPKLFGNKIFVVADRMNIRYQSRLDVWMPDEKQALNFGKQSAEIVVLLE